MPYDGSGNFTRAYNWVADKLAAIKITASRMDAEFDNYATAMNQVILRSGVAPMTGDLKLGNNKVTGLGVGAVGTPSLTFTGDTTTGMYLPAAGELGFSIAGVKRGYFSSTGLVLPYALSVAGVSSIHGAFEACTVAATAANGVMQLDYATNALKIWTANATANFSFNVRGDAGTTLDSIMAAGQALTLAVEVPQGVVAYYCTAIAVDGAAVTVKWFGAAPTAGNVSGIDVYTITIIKTGAATFVARASLAQAK